MRCIEVIDDNWEYKHIPNVVNTVLTLCGFVDVNNRDVEGIPDCTVCLDVLHYWKRLRVPKGLIKGGIQ